MNKTKSKRSLSNKMSVLYSKEKLLVNNNARVSQPDSLTSLAMASGDCMVPSPRCRLCSSTAHLKNFNGDHFNEVLSRLFEVEVPETGMICEACIQCLKVCERFNILVNSAFLKKPRLGALSCDKTTETDQNIDLPTKNPQKEIIELLTATLNVSNRKKKPPREVNKTLISPTLSLKRTNIACTVCLQRYPMIAQGDGLNNFICSRCKQLKPIDSKRKSPQPLTAQDLRSKNNLMGRIRSNTVQKEPPHITTLSKSTKHQCPLCPKSYIDPQNLTKHMKTMHEPCYICFVCGKKIKNKDVYERHLTVHSSTRSENYTPKKTCLKLHSSFHNNFETVIRS